VACWGRTALGRLAGVHERGRLHEDVMGILGRLARCVIESSHVFSRSSIDFGFHLFVLPSGSGIV
jgi:hypothetical protein